MPLSAGSRLSRVGTNDCDNLRRAPLLTVCEEFPHSANGRRCPIGTLDRRLDQYHITLDQLSDMLSFRDIL